MKNSLKIALVQQSCAASREENLEKSMLAIREAAARGAGLVVLPELHCGPYFCQTEDPDLFDLAEPIPGPTSALLARLARETGVVIVGSLFEKRAPGLCHNTAVVLDQDGQMKGIYRKMHIPDDPGYYEKFYFTPGDLGFTPVDTSVGRLGILVCWDQWYPEAARLMTLAGAELLLYPTAIGWNPDDDPAEQQRQLDAWITIQRAHAIANGIPVASCNRIGVEPDPSRQSQGIRFWGNSFVAGPQGELLERAEEHDDRVIVVELSLRRSEAVRRLWPFLRDRRIDAYAALTERFLD